MEATPRLSSLYVEPEQRVRGAEPPALELLDVFKIFRSGLAETVALRGLDLRVEPRRDGRRRRPVGLREEHDALARRPALDEPSAGEVRVAGRSLARLDEASWPDYRAREIGDRLPGATTSGRRCRPARTSPPASGSRVATERRVRAAARRSAPSACERRADHTPDRLSGGEQQRVAIAARGRAAAAPRARRRADRRAGRRERGDRARGAAQAARRLRSTVVIVTHSERVAEACDRVVEIADGRVE